MGTCCSVEHELAPVTCPECGQPGRKVETITLKALLRPEALARLGGSEHRFCPTSHCAIVYFGREQAFRREDVPVGVFQKEQPGDRTVCYCFAETERGIRREVEEKGRSTAAERITRLVAAGRCACELRNPQGSCCLGNVMLAIRDAMAAVEMLSRG